MPIETTAALGLAIIGLCLCLILASVLIATAFAVLGEQRKVRASAKPNRWVRERHKLGLD